MINLIYPCKYRYGGIASFCAHLSKCFPCRIIKPGKVYKKGRAPLFEYEMMPWSAIKGPCLLIKSEPEFIPHVEELAKRNPVALVVHDPNEVREGGSNHRRRWKYRCWLGRVQFPLIAIREHTSRVFKDVYEFDTTFIPHPYERRDVVPNRKWLATTLCKIFAYKNLPMVFEAAKQVEIHLNGEISMRPVAYAYDQSTPEWRDWYKGEFDDAVEVASQYEYVVDLTSFPYDGGGTQYTFLEAWNAGCTLIVHHDWMKDSTIGQHCIAVGSAEELVEALRSGVKKTPYDLSPHDPKVIGQRYMEVLKW